MKQIPEIESKFENVIINEKSEDVLSECRFLLLGGFLLHFFDSKKSLLFNEFKVCKSIQI